MSYVANKDGGANEVFFFPAALKNNQKGKFKMKMEFSVEYCFEGIKEF